MLVVALRLRLCQRLGDRFIETGAELERVWL